MKLKKYLHPLQYRRDMKEIDQLFSVMTAANKQCEEAICTHDFHAFSDYSNTFSKASMKVEALRKKWV